LAERKQQQQSIRQELRTREELRTRRSNDPDLDDDDEETRPVMRPRGLFDGMFRPFSYDD
jgi:hypothetical protein